MEKIVKSVEKRLNRPKEKVVFVPPWLKEKVKQNQKISQDSSFWKFWIEQIIDRVLSGDPVLIDLKNQDETQRKAMIVWVEKQISELNNSEGYNKKINLKLSGDQLNLS